MDNSPLLARGKERESIVGACIPLQKQDTREKEPLSKAKKVAGVIATLTRLERNQSVSNTTWKREQTKAGPKPVVVQAHGGRMKKKDGMALHTCHSVGPGYCSDWSL